MNISLLNVDIFGEVWSALKSFFFGILYAILKALLFIVDFCETIVKKLAGIDSIYYNGQLVNENSGDTITGDIIEVIIRTDVVRNLLISLLVLGIILLLLVTFISVWKTEWDFGKEGNSKTKILTGALKALFNFIAVPVIAFFGIFVGNALLRAIDSATMGGESQTFSSFVMSSSFANACKDTSDLWVRENMKSNINVGTEANPEYKKGILCYFTDANGNLQTQEIIEAFQSNTKMPKPSGEDIGYVIVDTNGSATAFREYNTRLENGTFVFSYDDSDLVTTFFDNSKINYLLVYLILIFIIKAMLTITYGLIKRLYYVVILFIISPPIVAMSPINSKALDEWKKMFIANVCSAFITVAIYNIFLSIYPMFQNISLFTTVGGIENFFVQLIFIAVGLQVIAGLSGEISKMLGLKDVYADSTDKGKTLWGGALGMAGSAIKPASTVIGKIGKYAAMTKYHGLGEAAKSLGKDVAGGAKGVINKSPIKGFVDNMGLGGLSEGKNFKNANEIPDQLKTVKIANKGALNDLKNARNDINNLHLYGDKKIGNKQIMENINNDESYKNYIQSKNTIDRYKGQWKDLNAEQRKEKQDAQKYLKNLSASDKSQLETKQKFKDAYDIASNTGGSGLLKGIKQDSAVKRMQKQKLNMSLSEKEQNKIKQTNEAIMRQNAKDTVKLENQNSTSKTDNSKKETKK